MKQTLIAFKTLSHHIKNTKLIRFWSTIWCVLWSIYNWKKKFLLVQGIRKWWCYKNLVFFLHFFEYIFAEVSSATVKHSIFIISKANFVEAVMKLYLMHSGFISPHLWTSTRAGSNPYGGDFVTRYFHP